MTGIAISDIGITGRISSLKKKTMDHKRYLSLEQALIITSVYKRYVDDPVILKRAKALRDSLTNMSITIDPEELIVGNRTPGIRAGIVFPESGISWISREIETLHNRTQDTFHVKPGDIQVFRDEIEPYWTGRSLEDDIYNTHEKELSAIEKVVKINQKDHAQGHICPDVEKWLRLGPEGLLQEARSRFRKAEGVQKLFYESTCIVLEASKEFMCRYADLADRMAAFLAVDSEIENLNTISAICRNLASRPPETFREALQSLWFLFVILHMESNASSFSPGRMDQYLIQYLENDLNKGIIQLEDAQEQIDALFVKFNQIVYMRNAHSAKYFAGFPIGFNVTLGGQDPDGGDATNLLSNLILKAQDHIRLPQPNLTARLHKDSPDRFIRECTRVIGLGGGMPQIVNDESIIPALEFAGVDHRDAMDYALVGCVELSTQGNYLGWSDAAMFNMVKALELSLNDGKCLRSGKQIGVRTGTLAQHKTYHDLEKAFRKQIDHFAAKMFSACEVVERAHQDHLPSPFLSTVVNNCMQSGKDVTAGGAKYNYSGVQAIQIANIADSLAVLKSLVFERGSVSREELLNALENDFNGFEQLCYDCINKVPKYGNDVEWVDELGTGWAEYFYRLLRRRKNFRGGNFQMGLYTVTAHVPMGENVGATPDGRKSGKPLADGGMSPMYGRDQDGPSAVLNSVARIPSELAGNGTLLNMKFLPSFFASEQTRAKFSGLLKSFVHLPIHHVQFNVITREDLLRAKQDPDRYRGLIVRVAGYSAFFTELSPEMQDEIIERTSHGDDI